MANGQVINQNDPQLCPFCGELTADHSPTELNSCATDYSNYTGDMHEWAAASLPISSIHDDLPDE